MSISDGVDSFDSILLVIRAKGGWVRTSKQLSRVYWLLLSVITANNTLVRLLAAWPPMREFSRFDSENAQLAGARTYG
jgi:hypothetical protein